MAGSISQNARKLWRQFKRWLLGSATRTSRGPINLEVFTPITVRTSFGKVRIVELLERRGVGAMCQTIDEGPTQLVLITRRQVKPEHQPVFDRFMRQPG